MKQTLLAEEQFSTHWKLTAILSTILAILFCIIFLVMADPLWKGVFRFMAFIMFIGIVFSFLRLREGQKTLQLELDDEHLLVNYFHKSESLKEEVFERKTIKDIFKKEYKPLKILNLYNDSYQYFITFTDTKNELPLFIYSGRSLRFSTKEAAKIDRYIEAHIRA